MQVYKMDKKKVSIAVVAMDNCGHLLHALIQFVGKAITAEALERALQNGLSKVHILSDAKNVVQILQKKVAVSWEIDTASKDIWTLMRSFEKINIIYILRTWNVQAHNLA